MKILQVNKHYLPSYSGAAVSGYQNIGGVEKVVASFAHGLARSGMQVRVLACQGKRAGTEHFAADGVECTIVSSLGVWLSTPISPAFFRYWRESCSWADIVHVHEPFPLATLACLIAPPVRPIVVSWHADIGRKNPVVKFVVQQLQRRLTERAARILPTSLRLAEYSPLLKSKITKCTPLPIGIPLEPFEPGPETDSKARELRDRYRARFGLFVGRLVPYKGLDTLLDALVLAKDVCFVIAGEGPLEAELRARIVQLGLQQRVWLNSGFVVPAELANWYAACEFFVLPSTQAAEAFGIVQIEAMASGRPVINTNLPTGVPEVSLHGISGLTVDPRDTSGLAAAMLRLWNDSELRTRLGAAAFRRAREEFSEQRMIARLIGIYESVKARQ